MTVAVLKNRLLDLSNRSFLEKDFGARSILEFVRLYPDLLDVDTGHQPPMVSLKVDLPPIHDPELAKPARLAEQPTPRGAGSRIREDLWRSVVDYSSGQIYVWDGTVAVPTERVAQGDGAPPVLPTLSRHEMDQWKASFVSTAAAISPDSSAALERWRERGLSAKALPKQFVGEWNEELKNLVVDRLNAWFDDRKLPLPSDLVSTTSPPQRDDAEELRAALQRCVAQMTQAELIRIQVPLSVVARLAR